MLLPSQYTDDDASGDPEMMAMNARKDRPFTGYDGAGVGVGNGGTRGGGYGSPPLMQVNVWALVMHAAKGLEFDEVLLPFWNEGIVPPRPLNGRLPVMVEERKLAFVSLTRARERVMISYAKAKDDHSRFPLRPSSLVEELLCLEEISAAFVDVSSPPSRLRLESLNPKIPQSSSSIDPGRNKDRIPLMGGPMSNKKRTVSLPRVDVTGTVGSMWDINRGGSVDHNRGNNGLRGGVAGGSGGGSGSGGMMTSSSGEHKGGEGSASSKGQVAMNNDHEDETPIKASNWNEYRSHVNNHDATNANHNAPLNTQASSSPPSPSSPTSASRKTANSRVNVASEKTASPSTQSSVSVSSIGQQQQQPPQYHTTTTHPHLIDFNKLREDIGNGGAKASSSRSRGKKSVQNNEAALTQTQTTTSTSIGGDRKQTPATATTQTAAKKVTPAPTTPSRTTTKRISAPSDNTDNDDGVGDTLSPLTPKELSHILSGSPALLRQKGMKERIKAQLKNLGQEGGNSILVATSDGTGTEKKQFSKLNARQLGEYLLSLWQSNNNKHS